ncbi:MAG: response regulator [Desulfobacteraceae bacterium]|nr:response regulator [Desulfobacteraceae bacterium]MCF8094078.1 response regulator [Desulfobacteraceae bacterium]
MPGKEKKEESIRILLVDDEQEFVTTLSERLQMRGFDAEPALDGEQAIESLNSRIPDVMVLDLRMPGLDGIEVLRRVKKQHPEIEIIILTGHGSDRDEDQARRLGALDYLQKPVGVDTLVQRIKKAYKYKTDAASMDESLSGEEDQKFMDKNTKKK